MPRHREREIASYLSAWDLRTLSKVCPSFDEITGQELNFRERVQDIAHGKKFIDSYLNFEGLEKLSASEMVMMTEVLAEKAEAKEEKNNTEILLALVKAFHDSAFRIVRSEPPSKENGRICSKNIQGIPPSHQLAIMLPNFLVTFYDAHSYLFELKNSETHKNMMEASPCTKYGKNRNAQHIHPGECRAVSANTKIIVLHCPDRDEIKILAECSEKSFTSRDAAHCRNGEIFSDARGKFCLSPDGKSLCFLSGTMLVRGFSNTPLDAETFQWESVDLRAYRDNYPYEHQVYNFMPAAGPYETYHMEQAADHTWAVVFGYDGGSTLESIFLPLPLGSAPFKIFKQKDFDTTIGTTILPDNTIAAITMERIKIFGADTKARAAIEDVLVSRHGDYDKIKVSPDGRFLAALMGAPGRSNTVLALCGIPPVTSASLLGGFLNLRAEPAKLSHLWDVRLAGPVGDYDFTFIDYGSKLALSKRANPSERIIIELAEPVSTDRARLPSSAFNK